MKKIIVLLSIIFIGCTSDIEDAQSSLKGQWKIIQIDFSDEVGTNNQIENPPGLFIIDDTSVEYSFVIDGEIMENKFDYQLVKTRENAGFVKVDRFHIKGEENYLVRFGDQTDDAHLDAMSIQLEKIEEVQNSNEYFILSLEKE